MFARYFQDHKKKSAKQVEESADVKFWHQHYDYMFKRLGKIKAERDMAYAEIARLYAQLDEAEVVSESPFPATDGIGV